MVAKRGIMFDFTVAVSPDADKALTAFEKRIEAIQKRAHLTMDLRERGERLAAAAGARNGGAGSNGSNAANGSSGPSNGSSAVAANADIRAAARERAEIVRERAAQREQQRALAAGNRQLAQLVKSGPQAVAQDKRTAEREAAEAREGRRRLSEARRDADEQDRISAERTAAATEKANRASLEQQTRDLKKAAAERQRVVRAAEREDETGWRRLSEMGRERFSGGKKIEAGFARLSDMGRAAMPRDEMLARMAEHREKTSGFAGLGAAGKETAERLEKLRDIKARDAAEENRRRNESASRNRTTSREAAESQAKITNGVYDTVHAFGQLTRAAAQFGLVGQRDMAKVLDTIFAVEGSINALQGVMGAARAIGGMRGAGGRAGLGPAAALSAGPLARMFMRPMMALGARSVPAAVGLAGAGVTALTAGAIGAAGTVADYRRGGGPGHVGGFWDTALTKGAINPAVAGAGLLMRGAMAAERRFNEPYGTSQRESIARQIGQLDKYLLQQQRAQRAEPGRGQLGFFSSYSSGNAAIGGAGATRERARLLTEATKLEIDRRNEILDRRNMIAGTVGRFEVERRGAGYQLAEQRHEIRAGKLQRRTGLQGQLLGEAFGRQQTAHGEQLELQQRRSLGQYVNPAQAARAAAEEAREEGLVTRFDDRRLAALRLAKTANEQRGRKVGQEYHAANKRYEDLRPDYSSIEGAMRARGSEQELANAAGERDAANERLKQVADERLKIEEQIRRVGIEGAQRQLQLREQGLATAKQTADALRGEGQSAKERFGRLLPQQQAGLIEAAEAMKAGRANRLQAERLREYGDLFGPELRQRDVKLAEQGGFDRFAGSSSLPGRLQAAEAKEQQAIKLTVDQRQHVTAELNFDAEQAAEGIAKVFIPLLQRAHDDLLRQIDKKIEDANHDMARQMNEQGRLGAGGS